MVDICLYSVVSFNFTLQLFVLLLPSFSLQIFICLNVGVRLWLCGAVLILLQCFALEYKPRHGLGTAPPE